MAALGVSGHPVCQGPRAAPRRHQLPPTGQGMPPASAALHCFLECFLTSLLGLKRETRSFPRPFPDDRSAAKPFLFQRGRAGVCLGRHLAAQSPLRGACWSILLLSLFYLFVGVSAFSSSTQFQPARSSDGRGTACTCCAPGPSTFAVSPFSGCQAGLAVLCWARP